MIVYFGRFGDAVRCYQILGVRSTRMRVAFSREPVCFWREAKVGFVESTPVILADMEGRLCEDLKIYKEVEDPQRLGVYRGQSWGFWGIALSR